MAPKILREYGSSYIQDEPGCFYPKTKVIKRIGLLGDVVVEEE